jgi:hypothetical protein
MSNQLDKGALLRAVTCILGMEGSDAGLTRLAEELTVGLDPWSQFEFALCREEMWGAISQILGAGGAGFRSIVQVHNDSTDALVVVELGSSYSLSAAGNVVFSRSNVQATTDGGQIFVALDGRWIKAAIPYARLRSQNGVALPAGINNGTFAQPEVFAANLRYDQQFRVLLRPQDTFSVFPNTDNTGIKANFVVRARRILNARELTL